MAARIPGLSRRVRPFPELASLDYLLPFAGVGKRRLAHLAVRGREDEFEDQSQGAGPSRLPREAPLSRPLEAQSAAAARRVRKTPESLRQLAKQPEAQQSTSTSRPRIPKPPLKPLRRSASPNGTPPRSPATTKSTVHSSWKPPRPPYPSRTGARDERNEKAKDATRPQRAKRSQHVVFSSVYSVYNRPPRGAKSEESLESNSSIPPEPNPSTPPSTALADSLPNQTQPSPSPLSINIPDRHPWTGYRSFTHYALSLPTPPSASVILEHLRVKPSLITKTALKSLAHYARQTGDQESELKSVQALLKLDPREQGLFYVGAKPKIDKRANRMLFHLFPPRQSLRTDDVQSVLCDLHYRLLTASEDKPPPTYQEALDAVRAAARLEGRSARSLDVANRSTINLFVVYCESIPGNPGVLQVLEEILALCGTRPTGHNLYCAVNQLLFPRSLQPYHPPWPKIAPKEVKKKQRPLLHPSTDPEVLSNLGNLLDLFRSRWGTFPTAATNKHILMFSSGTNNIALAADAFKAFEKSFDFEGYSPPSDGEHARFRRKGKAWQNFRNQARALKHKGWVEVLSDPKPGERKYRFVGLEKREGEKLKAGQRENGERGGTATTATTHVEGDKAAQKSD